MIIREEIFKSIFLFISIIIIFTTATTRINYYLNKQIRIERKNYKIQRDETIKSLINIVIYLDALYDNKYITSNEIILINTNKIIKNEIKFIELITNKKWDEIKKKLYNYKE